MIREYIPNFTNMTPIKLKRYLSERNIQETPDFYENLLRVYEYESHKSK